MSEDFVDLSIESFTAALDKRITKTKTKSHHVFIYEDQLFTSLDIVEAGEKRKREKEEKKRQNKEKREKKNSANYGDEKTKKKMRKKMKS